MISQVDLGIEGVPFINEDTMHILKSFFLETDDFDDEDISEDLIKLAFGFIMTTALITLIVQITIYCKNSPKQIDFFQVRKLESLQYYTRVLANDKYCIFFRNCLTVINTLFLTFDNYKKLKFSERRRKFFYEVKCINYTQTSSGFVTVPHGILTYRRDLSAQIRIQFQFYSALKGNRSFTFSETIWNNYTSESFVLLFEKYMNVTLINIINKNVKYEEFKNVNFFLVKRIFYMYKFDSILFDEYIGINTLPFEDSILQLSKKNIVRIHVGLVPNNIYFFHF